MQYEILLTKTAEKDLRKLNKNTAKLILNKLEFYNRQANPLKYAAKLTNPHGGGQYRFRIGEYRAVFDLRKSQITILYIEHRRDVYRQG